jgi:hypothetical protein
MSEEQLQEEQRVPTKEEFIAHLQEQIEIAAVRRDLQNINTEIAKARAEELNALTFIAQVTNPKTQLEEEEGEEEPKPRTLKKSL